MQAQLDMAQWHMSTVGPNQGLIDLIILYLQPYHIFRSIFYGEGYVLDVNKCDRHFLLLMRSVDPSVHQYINLAELEEYLKSSHLYWTTV